MTHATSAAVSYAMGNFTEIPSAPQILDLIDPAALQALRARAVRAVLPRGSAAYRQDGRPDRLFLLDEGKVKLERHSPDGRESIVALLGPGDVLGEACVFDDGPHTVSAVAVTDAVLLAVPTQALTAWLVEYPTAVPSLLRVLARRLRCASDSLAERTFSEVAARVARELLTLSHRFGRPVGAGVRVEHDLTQDELAQLVGSCRETVNKALGDFADRGWLQVEARAVVILAPERLARRARFTVRPCASGIRSTGPAPPALTGAVAGGWNQSPARA